MTIVADTSPIHYAVQIGIAEVILSLYGNIVVPAAVHRELNDAGAPDQLREWLDLNRSRIEVVQVKLPLDAKLEVLDPGEAEAILLAQQITDSILLIDEKTGRAEARRRGLKVTGLLGVIRDAALSGFLNFE